MKFCRFRSDTTNSEQFGILEGDEIRPINAPPWQAWQTTSQSLPLVDCHLLAPVSPSKIVCVGRNYAAHANELGNEIPKEPLIFLKPPSAIIGPGEPIVLPVSSQKVEHEAELAVVIGKTCRNLTSSDDPHSYVLGYTCLNDVTARDLQKRDVQFTRAKGFDTFCPVGPHLETVLDPANSTVAARVNGVVRQSGNTSEMIFPVAQLLAWISRVMTLFPGDLIATGTPSGVGPLVSGDVVEVEVSGIGILRNTVRASA